MNRRLSEGGRKRLRQEADRPVREEHPMGQSRGDSSGAGEMHRSVAVAGVLRFFYMPAHSESVSASGSVQRVTCMQSATLGFWGTEQGECPPFVFSQPLIYAERLVSKIRTTHSLKGTHVPNSLSSFFPG